MRRLLPHAADLRAELAAPDFAALCVEAVHLVREILVAGSPVEPREGREFALAGAAAGEAERFFRFVRELVYLADAEAFLPAAVTMTTAVARVAGERFDPARHLAERQVKAVTRHGYRFETTAEGLRVEVVFDL